MFIPLIVECLCVIDANVERLSWGFGKIDRSSDYTVCRVVGESPFQVWQIFILENDKIISIKILNHIYLKERIILYIITS